MQKTKCMRCGSDAILSEFGTMIDNTCLITATCTNYDCGGEQRHKFVIDDTTCDHCGSEDLQPTNNYEFLPCDEDENHKISQQITCMNCGEKWDSVYTQVSKSLC